MPFDKTISELEIHRIIEEKINNRFPLPREFFPGWKERENTHIIANIVFDIVKIDAKRGTYDVNILLDILARLSASGELDNVTFYLPEIDEMLYELHTYARFAKNRKIIRIACKIILDEYGLFEDYDKRYEFWLLRYTKEKVASSRSRYKKFKVIHRMALRTSNQKYKLMEDISKNVAKKKIESLLTIRSSYEERASEIDTMIYHAALDLGRIEFWSIYDTMTRRMDFRSRIESTYQGYEKKHALRAISFAERIIKRNIEEFELPISVNPIFLKVLEDYLSEFAPLVRIVRL
jgi:hypothetical protein